MTAKEYLSQLWKVQVHKRAVQERIDELTIRAGYGTGRSFARNYSGCNDRHCRMEEEFYKKWELEDQLEEELAGYDNLEREILAAIHSVPNERFRTILILRYIEFYSWERIAKDQGYEGDKGMRRLFRHHGDALEMVRIPNSRKNTTYCA